MENEVTRSAATQSSVLSPRTSITITTPEHVHIRLEPAGLGSRFLALLVDSIVPFGISFTVGTILTVLVPSIGTALHITLQFVLSFGWHIGFETLRQGQTPGKRALKLRVVDARGLPVSLHQSLVRNITRMLDFLPLFYGVAAVAAITSANRRRLGDVIADTLVIRESQPLAWQGQLASRRRHNSLRTPRVMRAIRHRIGLEERELLLTLCLRAEKMTPEARYDLMEEVARAYREKLGIEDEGLSGENLVRDLTSALFDPQGGESQRSLMR